MNEGYTHLRSTKEKLKLSTARRTSQNLEESAHALCHLSQLLVSSQLIR